MIYEQQHGHIEHNASTCQVGNLSSIGAPGLVTGIFVLADVSFTSPQHKKGIKIMLIASSETQTMFNLILKTNSLVET